MGKYGKMIFIGFLIAMYALILPEGRHLFLEVAKAVLAIAVIASIVIGLHLLYGWYDE